MDLLYRGAELGFPVIGHPRLERCEDLHPPFALHGQDEGKTELLLVRLIQFLKPRELLRTALIETGPGLLGRGRFRKFAAHRCLARQIRVSLQDAEALGTGVAEGVAGPTEGGGPALTVPVGCAPRWAGNASSSLPTVCAKSTSNSCTKRCKNLVKRLRRTLCSAALGALSCRWL